MGSRVDSQPPPPDKQPRSPSPPPDESDSPQMELGRAGTVLAAVVVLPCTCGPEALLCQLAGGQGAADQAVGQHLRYSACKAAAAAGLRGPAIRAAAGQRRGLVPSI